MDAADFKQKAQPSCAHLLCNDECDPSSAHCGRITEVFDEHNRKVHLMPSPPPDMLERASEFARANPNQDCHLRPFEFAAAFAVREREAAMEEAAKIVDADAQMSREALVRWNAAGDNSAAMNASGSYGAGKRIAAAIRALKAS